MTEEASLNQRIQPAQLLKAVNMLKVIAHPVRLSIVDALITHKELTLLQLQEILNLEQPIASQHTVLMVDKGVLLAERQGRNKYFKLRFPKMKSIISCMENCCTEL